MTQRADIAVVGGGILGLAHAYGFARAGRRVVLFERNGRAAGASVRNFGMLWPIGQPAGEMHAMALRSRALWLEALARFHLPYRNCGSLHLAYHDDEAEVLREFAALGPVAGYECEWLTAEAALRRSPGAVAEGLRGALWSATELTVDPRRTLAALPRGLEEMGVTLRFGAAVHEIALPRLRADEEEWEVERAVVCGGDDFTSLYPETFRASGLTRCKLQMMRTAPQPGGWELGPALAAGLTLRFYKSFRLCTTLPRLAARIAAEKPEYERWGIHVLVSQAEDGAITLGDSHEYGPDPDPFTRQEIDDLVLREAATFLRLPDTRIAERWHGVYALHPERGFFEAEPAPGVRIVTAPGGSGMTLAFGLAERTVKAMAV